MNNISVIHFALLGAVVSIILGFPTENVSLFILYALIPILIYSASVNINLIILKENIKAVVNLATFGVIITCLFVAVCLWLFLGIEFKSAIVFGALISTTDPVAVVALFNELNVDEKLTTTVDCESLFNDSTALVLFTALMSYGVVWSLPAFVIVSIVSLAIGFFTTLFLRKTASHFELGLMVMVLFAITTYLGLSGIFAVTAFGFHLTLLKKEDHIDFFNSVSTHYNNIVFFLCGLLSLFLMKITILEAIVVIAALLLSRALIVWLFMKDNKLVAWWGGGLRGILPLVMALSLPLDFPFKEQIVSYTCCIILFSLVVQGTTVKYLIKSIKSR